MEILNEKLVKLNLDAKSSEEIIKDLGNLMYEQKKVKNTYVSAVIEREKKFPTGLPSNGVYVAIPHTDSIHVSTSCIAIATLKNPVQFSMMGDEATKLNVEMVFLLAIEDPDKQVTLLKNLMGLLQNKELLLKVKNSKSVNEVLDLLNMLEN